MRKGNKYNGSNSSQVPLHTHRQKEKKKTGKPNYCSS